MILRPGMKIKAASPGLLRSCSLFNLMLSVLGLQDFKTFGGRYTWLGKRSKYTIMSRIDRAVANCDWLDKFPMATVSLLPWIGSDHRPLLLDTNENKRNKAFLFRYDSRWRLYPGLKQMVEQVYGQENSNLSYGIHSIILQCIKALSRWRSKQITTSQKVIQRLKQEIQGVYDSPIIDYNLLTMLKAKFQLQYRLEEEYWRTKSRVLWLQAGDKNTKYFHNKTRQRRHYNRIAQIQDDQGKLLSKPNDIHRHIENYFLTLYKSHGSSLDNNLMSGIPVSVTEEMNRALTAPILEKEIKEAVFKMNPEKASGPDGMTPNFYRQHWDSIKPGLLSFIKIFFEQERLDPKVNQTHICLIPKVENPITIQDYMPISLANVAYKTISKILAERLKPWLNSIISEN